MFLEASCGVEGPDKRDVDPSNPSLERYDEDMLGFTFDVLESFDDNRCCHVAYLSEKSWEDVARSGQGVYTPAFVYIFSLHEATDSPKTIAGKLGLLPSPTHHRFWNSRILTFLSQYRQDQVLLEADRSVMPRLSKLLVKKYHNAGDQNWTSEESQSELEWLGELRRLIVINSREIPTAASVFLYRIVDELSSDLESQNVAKVCPVCDRLFRPTNKIKKYCNERSEARACDKSARNRKYYVGHHDEVLKKSRERMREDREVYRELGLTR